MPGAGERRPWGLLLKGAALLFGVRKGFGNSGVGYTTLRIPLTDVFQMATMTMFMFCTFYHDIKNRVSA